MSDRRIPPLLGLALAVLTGCAFSIPIRPSLEGSRWQIRSINGEAVPPLPNYYVEFRHGQISGRMGCNQFSGPYRLDAEAIVVGGLSTTEMACDAATTAHEAAGFAALRGRSLRIFWTDLGARLVLTSATGSIDLRRMR